LCNLRTSDIGIVSTTGENERIITKDTYSDDIAWHAEDVIDTIDVETYRMTSATSDEEIANDILVGRDEYFPVTSKLPMRSLSGGQGGYAYYAYKGYVIGGPIEGETTAITASVYNIVNQTKTFAVSDSDGTTLKVSNPIVDGTDGMGAQAFAENIYAELRYNLIASFKHRGFPELEAGDIIQLESKSNEYVSVRVLENTLSIQQGRVSGATKVRRLT
jgi:hypothetical protein